MNRTPLRTILFFSAAFACMAAAAAAADDAFFLKPSRVDPGKAFALEVLSFRYNCGTVFSDASFSRDGSRIAVRFVAKENPAAICPAIERPFGPKLDLPALTAGRYQVYATALLPCQVGKPACEIPEREEPAGILTVGKQEDADWFVQPASVAPARSFTLKVLNDKFGNCQTSFSHASHTVRDGKITASFSIETNPNIVCLVDIHPHGPSFEVGALKAGKYPVQVIEIPACIYNKPPCPWLPPDMVARVVDTLVVASSTAIGAQAIRPDGGAQARLVRGNLSVTLPPGEDSWTAEITDLSGRVLRQLDFGSAARRVVEFRAAALPDGLLLLRLRSQGRSMLLPIISAD